MNGTKNSEVKKKASSSKVPVSGKKKAVRALLYILTFGILAALGVYASLNVFFKIATVTISAGEDILVYDGTYEYAADGLLMRYQPDTVIEWCGIKKGGSLLKINSSYLEKNIPLVFPYVKSAVVEVRLPDKVFIRLEEEVPKYIVDYSGRYLILSAEWKVLEETEMFDPSLTYLSGVSSVRYGSHNRKAVFNDADFRLISRILEAIGSHGIESGVSEINIKKSYALYFIYNDIHTCMLGDSSDLDKKTDAFLLVYAKHDESIPSVIDVSDYNNVRYKVDK